MIVTTAMSRDGGVVKVERIHVKHAGFEFNDRGGQYIDIIRPGETVPDDVLNRVHGDDTELPFEPTAVAQAALDYVNEIAGKEQSG